MPALRYLDGEPAQAVLEVQRSLVFAEGNGISGVQPLKLLLVVDHKNLPENTMVRLRENTSTADRAKAGGHRIAALGLENSGERVAHYTLVFPLKGEESLDLHSFQSSS